tara:strand:+ start:7709 stop:7942 length:234 start_codon:yes stop_codon:yes gene_type:complete
MNSKIALIIQREFMTRIRKRSFLIMTILGPVLSAGLFILPAYFATLPPEDRVIVVLDEASNLIQSIVAKESLTHAKN